MSSEPPDPATGRNQSNEITGELGRLLTALQAAEAAAKRLIEGFQEVLGPAPGRASVQ